MIKHIIKIIWIEHKANAWILLELVLVFCILWFCADYLYFTGKRYLEPKGFDIEHTYKVNIEMKDEGQKINNSGTDENLNAMLDDIWTIYDRIAKYPAIESVSFSHGAHPYSGSRSWSDFFVDSVSLTTRTKRITPGFFNVFKVDIISGTPFTDENTVTGDPLIISADRNDMIGLKHVNEIKQISFADGSVNNIIGIANKVKDNDYSDYIPIRYYPLKKDNRSIIGYRELCVRVKPEADKDFIKQFKKDMQSQLEVGHYFLTGIVPLEMIREESLYQSGYTGNFQSIYSISAFLIVNIFLGIVGTFWFRTQSRRSEIGLRIALGSSKTGIKKMFIGETLFILFLASIIASIICINIAMADILKDIGVPVIEKNDDKTYISQYFINYGITLIFLSVIAIIAVWYPSKKASDIQPAQSLRDE